MIKSIDLINFQSHADTRLEFDPGVNCIIGSSRSGKTAILRALIGNRYNKFGLSFNSYWNRDGKKIKSDYRSVVKFEEGTEVVRIREQNFNAYQTNEDKTFEALGANVPEEIEVIWNMNEINIQKQFDSPYLLGESSAEVARILNKTIKLDKIDKVLSEAESRRRKLNQNINSEKESLESLKKQYSDMNWIDDAEKLIIAAERRHDRIDNKQNERDDLLELLSDIKDLREGIVEIDFEPVLQKIEEYRKIKEHLVKMGSEAEILDNLLDQIDMYYQTIEEIPEGLEKAVQKMEEVENFHKTLTDKVRKLGVLEDLTNYIFVQNEFLQQSEKDLNKLNSMMPETCILCGAKINKEAQNEKA